MSRPRSARHPVRNTREASVSPPGDAGASIAAAAVALVLIGSALAVDPLAESAFDAPKRLVTLVGVAVAAAALVVFPRRDGRAWSWGRASWEQRIAVTLLAVAAAGAVLSALASPRRAASLDGLRVLALFSLLLPIGASRALEGRRGRVLLVAFLGAGAVNAAVFVLVALGAIDLFAAAIPMGRAGTGGFAGNEGHLAPTLALAAVTCLAVVLWARTAAQRAAGGAGMLLYLSALALAQNLTAILALLTGSIVLAAMLAPRRALVAVGLTVAVAAGAVVLHPAVARRAGEAAGAVRAGDWDRVLSYRFGPWAAALEMARARPIAGWGPGSFGAEFVPHRLSAEIRLRRRLVNPFLAGSYAEAHSDYLQAAAELGIPATFAVLGAGAAVLAGLLRLARGGPDRPSRREAIVLLAGLVAGTTAAVTWFPAQKPITMVPLLLAAGRAWRLSGFSALRDER